MATKKDAPGRNFRVEVVGMDSGSAACAHASYVVEDGALEVPESCLGCFGDTRRFHVGDVVKG